MIAEIYPSVLSGTVEAPPSKSCAHRALICAAISENESRIKTNGICDDVAATVNCLNALGAKTEYRDGIFSVIPIKVPVKSPVLPCGESASTLRFLLPPVCTLGSGAIFTVSGRLSERPLRPLTDELKRHGAEISDGFPLKVSGKLRSSDFKIPGGISSQFVSGILFSLALCGGTVEIDTPAESEPYVKMTADMLRCFGAEVTGNAGGYTVSGKCTGADITVEGDWSNSLYWLAAGVNVTGLDENSLQGDRLAAKLLEQTGGGNRINAENIPDSVPALAVKAAVSEGTTVITGASRLRYKESNRIDAIEAMLATLGADITGTADGFIINGKPFLNGGTVDSCGDHRIAFAAALASCFCRSKVTVLNAGCVGKSYPGFWEIFNQLGGNANVLLNR